jgi:hypothetical protein
MDIIVLLELILLKYVKMVLIVKNDKNGIRSAQEDISATQLRLNHLMTQLLLWLNSKDSYALLDTTAQEDHLSL